tara:strand:- start:693 stop:1088 length:396 start_codon:yes stop_codon:yes gene_type:complete
MLTLANVSIILFLIILTGWTLTTYFFKKDSQDSIREELINLFDICKQFYVSLKNFIGILVNHSLLSESNETSPAQETVLNKDEQLLKLVQPIKEDESTPLEIADEENDIDVALSSFSPEVVEVINQEENVA